MLKSFSRSINKMRIIKKKKLNYKKTNNNNKKKTPSNNRNKQQPHLKRIVTQLWHNKHRKRKCCMQQATMWQKYYRIMPVAIFFCYSTHIVVVLLACHVCIFRELVTICNKFHDDCCFICQNARARTHTYELVNTHSRIHFAASCLPQRYC